MGRPGKSKRKQPKLKSKQVSSSKIGSDAGSELHPTETQPVKALENSKSAPPGRNAIKPTYGSKNNKKH
jgi:hypothetical protein